jgi:hypothetical protein
MITFDIKHLYVNIPIKETLETTKTKLKQHNNTLTNQTNRSASPHFRHSPDRTHVSQVLLSIHETEYFHILWNESPLKLPDMSQRCHIIKHRLASLCAIGRYLISRKFMKSKMRFKMKMDSDMMDSVAPANHKHEKSMHTCISPLMARPSLGTACSTKISLFHEQICGN